MTACSNLIIFRGKFILTQATVESTNIVMVAVVSFWSVAQGRNLIQTSAPATILSKIVRIVCNVDNLCNNNLKFPFLRTNVPARECEEVKQFKEVE